jgi:transglutaminase-like putative cysteine protease
MPIYQITYNTRNEYSTKVRDGVLEFLIFPANLDNQRIESLEFSFEPHSAYYTGQNFFGFEFLRFRLKDIGDSFSFTLKASVFKSDTNPFNFHPIHWDDELAILQSDEFLIDNYLFLNESDATRIPEDYVFPQRENEENTFDYAQRINRFIHEDIEYDNRIVDPHRLLTETLSERRGVCQDLAHLMAAILRKNRIPTRYVSGYLNQGDSVVGTGAVHAWVEVLIPGAGWIGYDPTNNLLEDHHYIKIAHGQDISDCATLKGVIKGAGYNQTKYEVLVQEQNIEGNQQ